MGDGLGAVFLSGVAFLVLTLLGIRQWIVAAIPAELYAALSAGMAVGAMAGMVHWNPEAWRWSDMSQTALHLDVKSALGIGLAEIVFVFLFVDLFDNVGMLVAIAKKAGLQDENGRIPRVNRILLSDALATIGGSLVGTTTVVSYVESAAGVAAGGRTGVPAIVTGLLFICALFAAPVIGAIPGAATAPALIVVGSVMLSTIAEVRWDDVRVGFPAFLTLITIPLTFSIANGLAFGLIAYVLIHLAQGRVGEAPWAAYPLSALLMVRFIYLATRA